MWLSHLVAAGSAAIRSLQYGRSLGIRRGEWGRYFSKAINLGLCYVGFAPTRNLREAWKAGEAAFLCCAYDVVTDWRQFDERAGASFRRILRALVGGSEAWSLAMGLYETERLGQLLEDGLERGDIALRFTLKVMCSEEARKQSWGDLTEIGRLLQIVDDVLDYEEDLAHGDTNCLTSARRDTHLLALCAQLDESRSRSLFGESVLTLVIRKARGKAQRLLATSKVDAECFVAVI